MRRVFQTRRDTSEGLRVSVELERNKRREDLKLAILALAFRDGT